MTAVVSQALGAVAGNGQLTIAACGRKGYMHTSLKILHPRALVREL